MNDRLKELMNQTGVPTSIPFDQWCEKFAELIIRECANLPFKGTGEVTTIGEIAVSNLILEHFGVEE